MKSVASLHCRVAYCAAVATQDAPACEPAQPALHPDVSPRQPSMHEEFTFSIRSTCFDENYQPADSTRLTTNFANLARGESRRQNLCNTLRMINHRFNA